MNLRTLMLLALIVLVGCQGTSQQRKVRTEGSTAREDAAATQVSLGVGYIEKGRYEYAMQKLTRAIELDPQSSDAYTSMGLLFERIANAKKAEENYRKAVQIAPQRGSVRNNLGQYLCRTGRYKEASIEFELALEDPFYATPELAASNAGACARAGGDMVLAERFLRRALERKPDFIDAYLPMAEVLSARGEYMKARAFAQRHEATGIPLSAQFYAMAANIESKLNNPSGAREYVDKLIAQFPNSDEAIKLNPESAQ
jgi:type IV pilus assembly protein PilF